MQSSLRNLLENRLLTSFVGRIEEISTFDDCLSQSTRKQHHPILCITGQGGIGKTTLLIKLLHLARKQGVLTAFTDHHEDNIPAVLITFAHQLEAQGVRFPNFHKHFRMYLSQDSSFQSASEGGQLTSSVTRLGLKTLQTVSTFGIPLKAVDADAAGQIVDHLASLVALRRHSKVTDARPEAALSRAFVYDLKKISNKKRIVFFFDTFEVTASYIESWLTEFVGGGFGDVPSDIHLVVAGRREFDASKWSPWLHSIQTISLHPFSDDEAVELMRRLGVTDATRIHDIIHLSNGLPLLISMLASASTPVGVPVTSHIGVERFLQWTTDPVKRSIAITAAIPRHIDVDVLHALFGERASEAYEWLLTQQFVVPTSRGWEYHAVVRSQMLRFIRTSSMESWGQHQATLENYFRERQRAFHVQNGDLWQSERSMWFAVESVYHLLCHRGSAELAYAKNHFLRALRVKRAIARRCAEAITQAGADIDDSVIQDYGQALINSLIAYEKNDFATMIALLTALSDAHEIEQSSKAVALEWRGYCKSLIGNNIEAVIDITRALEIDPNFPDALEERGAALRQLGFLSAAISDLSEALRLNPVSAFGLRERGRALYRAEAYGQALADLDAGLNLNPEDGTAFAYRAETRLMVRNIIGAISDITHSQVLDPSDDWNNYLYGVALWLDGKGSDANVQFTRARERAMRDYETDSDNSLNSFNLALYMLTLEQEEEAIHLYDTILQHDPPLERMVDAVADLAFFIRVFPDRSVPASIMTRCEDARLRSTKIAAEMLRKTGMGNIGGEVEQAG